MGTVIYFLIVAGLFAIAWFIIAYRMVSGDNQPYDHAPYLTYEEFVEKYDQFLKELFAETGADRELDFDLEKATEEQYEKYLDGQYDDIYIK